MRIICIFNFCIVKYKMEKVAINIKRIMERLMFLQIMQAHKKTLNPTLSDFNS